MQCHSAVVSSATVGDATVDLFDNLIKLRDLLIAIKAGIAGGKDAARRDNREQLTSVRFAPFLAGHLCEYIERCSCLAQGVRNG
jgi:hypothetical protein